MNWEYEFVGQAIDQYDELDQEERDGVLDELDKVVQDHLQGRRPRHGKTEKLGGQVGRFRLKAWPRRALFRIEYRSVLDDKGKSVMVGEGKKAKSLEHGWIVVYTIEPRDKVYKPKK